MLEATATCFHCGEPLAGRTVSWARIAAAEVPFCCPGCSAAARMIADLGLTDFYTFRTSPASRPTAANGEWLAFDEPAVQQPITQMEADGRAIVLLIDGLTCAACSWLLTQVIERLDGVRRVSVNTATGRAYVVWDPDTLKLSHLLGSIANLGYRPHPVSADAAHRQARDERHALLKRLAVSGLGMMQVMMFVFPLYSADTNGMEADIRSYLQLVSLLVTTPALLYAGWPFLTGAARALRARSITMDVPVSLGLLLAYGASVWNTWRHSGEVYFDSVTMFIFFLTVARWVEMTARHKSTGITESLSRLLPVTAHRVQRGAAGESIDDVAVAQLKAGDELLVRAGEIIPADGILLDARTRLDESMLTGESVPVARGPGETLAAGTLNIDSPLRLRVAAVGGATILAGIVALLNRAQSERPRLTREADRTASRFLARVLFGAVVVCAAWLYVDPSRAFNATLAVLVVACPCALSLATLVAVASANAALARRGVLVSHADAIEGLARIDRVIFDKTGTLTSGEVSVDEIHCTGRLGREQALAIAASLEAASEHPIAHAFATAAPATQRAADVRIVPGEGVEGCIAGTRYRIGTAEFVARGFDAGVASDPAAERAAQAGIALGDERGLLATFTLSDVPRPEAPRAVQSLRAQGLEVEILSGDAPAAVERVARLCGIETCAARQSPAGKLQHVRELTRRGAFVAMVGDGINDAPVLGGAGVSVAMSRGSPLALASADLILVGDSLQALPQAVELARRARRIIRQNLVWAAGYNLAAMPLAALGWVPPWVAAIGMSASSIFVVLNSLRLMREPAREAGVPMHAALPQGT